jgi:hypothetical protein
MQTAAVVSTPGMPQGNYCGDYAPYHSPRARISVDEASTMGTFRNTHAGAGRLARTGAAEAGLRAA